MYPLTLRIDCIFLEAWFFTCSLIEKIVDLSRIYIVIIRSYVVFCYCWTCPEVSSVLVYIGDHGMRLRGKIRDLFR